MSFTAEPPPAPAFHRIDRRQLFRLGTLEAAAGMASAASAQVLALHGHDAREKHASVGHAPHGEHRGQQPLHRLVAMLTRSRYIAPMAQALTTTTTTTTRICPGRSVAR